MSGSSIRRLRLSNFKLKALLDVTLAINENLSTEQLLSKFLITLRKDLNIGNVLVYSYNGDEWKCILASGFQTRVYDVINVEKNLMKYTDITNLTTHPSPLLSMFDVVIPVFHKDKALAYVLIGDIDEEQDGISPTIKHLNFVQTLANIIIVAIENKRLARESLKQEAIRKELELASKMQNMLIPQDASLPRNDKLYVATFYMPHFEVGGDYYDFIKLSEHEYGFCIADVSGKGISAALLMSNFQANLRALFSAEAELDVVMRKLNSRIITITEGEKFITLFIAKYDSRAKQLYYINAGHNPPLLYLGEIQEMSYLTTGCAGLGMIDDIPSIHIGQVSIQPGSKLLCFTDGLVEVENADKKEFATSEIENCLSKNQKMSTIIKNIMNKLDDHRGSNPYFDDISIIGIEFH